ncbi:hypothetical protein Tco_0748350, partial [Tanacetum coccineum]
VMAASVISISSDLSVEKVGAAVVASPAGVLELDNHSSSKADPSESSLPPISVAPMVSPFLWRSRVASRLSSPTTSTPEIIIAPIPPAPSVVVASSTNIISPVDAPPRICRRRAILIRPREDILIALRYTSHHLECFTSGSSSDHSSSGHSISGYSLSGHTPPDTTIADSSTPPRFVYPPLARTPRYSEDYRCWRSPAATVTSYIHVLRALVPSRADLLPAYKRLKDSISLEDSVEEDIDTDVLADIEADATAVEVDVRVDVEDEVEDEVESSDRGTIEVRVDVVAEIDIPDGMLMPDAVERLEQVEEVVQDIYRHVMEIPLRRVEAIKTGQRELEARSLIAGGKRASLLEQVVSLERSNARLRGTVLMESARADRFWRHMSFMGSELRQIRRFCYYDKMRFRRLETFTARRLGFCP